MPACCRPSNSMCSCECAGAGYSASMKHSTLLEWKHLKSFSIQAGGSCRRMAESCRNALRLSLSMFACLKDWVKLETFLGGLGWRRPSVSDHSRTGPCALTSLPFRPLWLWPAVLSGVVADAPDGLGPRSRLPFCLSCTFFVVNLVLTQALWYHFAVVKTL